MKTLIEIKAILNAVAAVIPTQLGDMVRDCVQDIAEASRVSATVNVNSDGVIMLSEVEKAYVRSGQKIPCIKEIRTRLGLGLLEAKNLAEYWIERYNTNGFGSL